ncbi:MAG: hypothetical protein M1829_001499 [Trizodia sp. TS-e1964]|nr:MAG: hypothetical protein M1829_001499 [Trizodia sp. TS-e1964]
MHDERNIDILENIFKGQYKLEDAEVYKSRLVLLVGDQKIVQRLRAIARLRRDATELYERYDWYIAVPGLFHLQMNTLKMIHRAHFGTAESIQDGSSLYHAANFWNRKRLVSEKGAGFYDLQELVKHSFRARVVALAIQNLSVPSSAKLEDSSSWVSDALSNLRVRDFLELVDKIANFYALCTLDSKSPEPGFTQETRNHNLFLQHLQTSLLLRYGIKHGDIGLIRRLVDHLAIYFHGSKQHKYAYEMLYLQQLLQASCLVLQRAILSNSLVNLQGKPGSWFETDTLVKLHNGNMKHMYEAKHHWQVTLEDHFARFALSSAVLTTLIFGRHHLFVLPINGLHCSKDASKNLHYMATSLLADSLVLPGARDTRRVVSDLLQDGYSKLTGDPITKLNANKRLGDLGMLDETLDEPDEDALAGFFGLENDIE